MNYNALPNHIKKRAIKLTKRLEKRKEKENGLRTRERT